MPISFAPTNEFVSSSKMGEASVSMSRCNDILGEGAGECDGKCANFWSGFLTLDDGTKIKVAAWDWKGSATSLFSPYVSIWVETGKWEHLNMWKNFLEG